MESEAQPLVHMKDVKLTLKGGSGPVPVLKGVDLDLLRGQTLSVVGPSGAGKTTLLMVMAGLERISSGLVQVEQQDLAKLDEDALARFRRGRVGVVFQSFHLVPTMTALENACLPLEFAGVKQARQKALEALEAVGLSERLANYPSQLSGGEQQRVAIARAVAARPSLLLADEPTGNLDETTGQKVMDLLFNLQAETGASLVLITHDSRLAARSQRLVHMRDGRLLPENGSS
jgi:putative ABC transport system ATP-binding protein